MKVVPSTYHQCLKFLHHGTKITIHADLEPFAYYNVVESSYHNHFLGMKIGNTIASSSNTCHDPNTIRTSTLSIVKINYKGYGEYSLSVAFVVGAFPLDPHTYGCPTSQKEKKNSPPPQKNFGPATFVSNGILDGQESALDINTWLYRETPPKNQELLEYFSQKNPQSHKIVTKKWDYQGGGLG